MIPYKCPVCLGRGLVPAGFYHTSEIPLTSSANDEVCRTCANGIVWEPPCDRKHISEDGLKRLGSLYCAIWADACYDPYNESTEKFARKLLPDIQALNEELKFKE